MAKADFPHPLARARPRHAAAATAVALAACSALLLLAWPPGDRPAAGPQVHSPPRPEPLPRLRTRPLSRWLDEVARLGGRTLLLAPGLDEPVVAGQPVGGEDWRVRLEAMSRVYGFAYRLGPGHLEVERAQSAVEPERAGRGPDEAVAGAAPTAAFWQLRRARPERLAGLLSGAARELGVLLAVDRAADRLIAHGKASALEELGAMVAQLDRGLASVLLEAEIVELSRAARSELGVEWSVGGRLGAELVFPASTDSAASLLLGKGAREQLEARLSVLEAQGRVRVVSRPRLVTEEGSRALIESVRILRVRLPERAPLAASAHAASAASAGGATRGSAARAVESIPVGVTLEVEPSVEADGRVRMAVSARSSTLGAPQPPDGIPEELARRLSCVATVASGETLVLGGLLRSTHRSEGAGLPLLARMPLVGPLFGSRQRSRGGEELVVVVTPTVIRAGAD